MLSPALPPRANEAAAHAEASALLGRVPLPSGAQALAGEPPGDGGFLAHPGLGPPATPNAVDVAAWWRVPGKPSDVLGYVAAHAPAGARPEHEGPLTTNGVIDEDSVALEWPGIADVLSWRALVVEVTQLADGSTGLRADGQAVWITPRPPAERVPPGARLLRITVHSSIGANQPGQRPIIVIRRSRVEAIAGLVNGLPAAQPGVYSCPNDPGIRVRLAFFASPHRAPLAVADADPQGCGGVQLTLGGRPKPPLEEGGELIRRVARVLGVRINTTPAHRHISTGSSRHRASRAVT